MCYLKHQSLVHRTVNLITDFPIRKRKGNGIRRSQKWEVTPVIGVEVDFKWCVPKMVLCGLAIIHSRMFMLTFPCPLDRFICCLHHSSPATTEVRLTIK